MTTSDHTEPQLTTDELLEVEKIKEYQEAKKLLFEHAVYLAKGGAETEKIQILLQIHASCILQLNDYETIKDDIETIAADAYVQKWDIKRSLTEEIRQMVRDHKGLISTKFCHSELQLTTRKEKKAVNMALSRMVEEGLLEKNGDRVGTYRCVSSKVKPVDFRAESSETVKVWLPFGLSDIVELFPGNIIGVYGEYETGKTAVLLNIARYNMRKWQVHYFNSEMGPSEFKKRLSKFDDITIDDWFEYLKFYEVENDFHDQIIPGPGNLNIIDFLEIQKDFYLVGEKIKQIHERLHGALCVVALHKKHGTDIPFGGEAALQKPRLVIAISNNKIKITKAKNWAPGVIESPKGKVINFKIVNGCNLIQVGGWKRE